MCSGWRYFPGVRRSRIGTPVSLSSSPICQFHLSTSGSWRLLTMIPKMSEYDSLSAPLMPAYCSRAE